MDEQTIMGLIMTAGKAKSTAFEAIKAAKKGQFELAANRLSEAEDYLAKGHQLQTTALSVMARGDSEPPSLLAVHAQDHLSMAMTTIELGREIIDLYQKISENEH